MSSKSNIHSTIFRKMFITYHPSNPTLSFDTLVIFRHLQVFTVIFRTSWYVSYHQSSFDLRYLSVNLIMFRSNLSFGQHNILTVSTIHHRSNRRSSSCFSRTLIEPYMNTTYLHSIRLTLKHDKFITNQDQYSNPWRNNPININIFQDIHTNRLQYEQFD